MDNELKSKINNFITTPFGSLKGISATDKEIENAEEELNQKFSDDYIDFIKEFGGAYLGVDIYAFNNYSMMPSTTVVEINKDFRKTYIDREHSELINTSLVIAVDGLGNPIIISPEGKVIIIYHDSFDEMEILADSFNQFIDKVIGGEINDLF